MSNLMKAEWFRLRHSGNSLTSLTISIAGCIIVVLMQFVSNEGLSITAEILFTHMNNSAQRSMSSLKDLNETIIHHGAVCRRVHPKSCVNLQSSV